MKDKKSLPIKIPSMEGLHEKNIRMIRGRSKSISRQFSLEFDECLCEANLSFCLAYELYYRRHSGAKDGGASFSTYLWQTLKNNLLEFAIKEIKERSRTVNVDDVINSLSFDHNFDERIMFIDYVIDGDDDVREILELITEPPPALLRLKKKASLKVSLKITAQTLKKYLMKRRRNRWDRKRFNSARKKIAKALLSLTRQ